MNIKSVFISYLLTFIVFLMVDLLWLGIIAKNLYQKYLGDFLSDKVNWTAAFIFYLLYVAGILIFAVYYNLSAMTKKWVGQGVIDTIPGVWWVQMLLAGLLLVLLWQPNLLFYRRNR